MIKKHLLAWFGIALLAVLNGAARDLLYRPSIGELLAHQISTASLLVLVTAAAWVLGSRWPLRTSGEALIVGASWMLMTVAFECFAGRVVAGRPWDVLLRDYDLSAGRVWAFVPVWLAAVPIMVFRLRSGTAWRAA